MVRPRASFAGDGFQYRLWPRGASGSGARGFRCAWRWNAGSLMRRCQSRASSCGPTAPLRRPGRAAVGAAGRPDPPAGRSGRTRRHALLRRRRRARPGSSGHLGVGARGARHRARHPPRGHRIRRPAPPRRFPRRNSVGRDLLGRAATASLAVPQRHYHRGLPARFPRRALQMPRMSILIYDVSSNALQVHSGEDGSMYPSRDSCSVPSARPDDCASRNTLACPRAGRASGRPSGGLHEPQRPD